MPLAQAQTHRSDQANLGTLLIAELLRLWRGSTPPSVDVATALIQEFGSASAVLAASYYEQEREFARVTGRFTVPLADPPPPEQITRSLGWATRSLRDPDPDVAAVKSLVSGSSRRLAANTGRDTLIRAGVVDPVTTRWARVAGPNACGFCRMLATRGAVYLTEASARGQRGGYHDSCGCVPQILFPGQKYEPGKRVDEWTRQYAQVTADETGEDKLRAYRHAVEHA